jgi:N-acetylglucosaminyldiphosphoundecaprenol N-acetyl-beta-D-mannosaminyltransferase
MDAVTLEEAIERIAELVSVKRGGAVFTPNVDHIVKAEHDEIFRAAYDKASLSLVDGTPVLWASRALKTPLPEKVSGSDLVLPLMRRAAKEGWRVYLLGGAEGIADQAADVFRKMGVNIVGTDAPFITGDGQDDKERDTLGRILNHQPQLVLVALGAPKQELWIARVREKITPAVALGIGASLDFVTGKVTRAPSWVSSAGLEWVYRLAQEPRRLWRRYLVDDVAFAPIVLKTLTQPKASRVASG